MSRPVRRAFLTAWVVLSSVCPPGARRALAEENAARPVSAYESLGREIDSIVGRDPLGESRLGAFVIDSKYGITIFERNPDAAMALGSATKLFTLAAAFDQLGPEFRFRTELLVTGEIKKRKLKGALLVRGDGDPTMTSYAGKRPDLLYSTFDQWAKELRRQKIKTIVGPLIIDDSRFDPTPFATGWKKDKPSDPRVPWVSALNFNDNIGEIYWLARGKIGNTAKFETLPDLEGGFLISNSVKLTDLDVTRRTYNYPSDFRFINVRGSHRIGAEAHDRIALLQPALYYGVALKERLGKKGIEVTGPVLRWKGAQAPGGKRPFRHVAMRISKPLSKMAQEIFADDRHLDTEVLYKRMGAELSGEAGTFDNGRDAVMAYIARSGITNSELLLLDGSGLSSFNRASARRLVELMASLRASAFAEHFERALPRLTDAGGGELVGFHGWFVPVPGGAVMAGWVLTERNQPILLGLLVQSETPDAEVLRDRFIEIVRAIRSSRIG